LSQSALAERLGITFQQVQKYEKGSNRVGSSRLQHIAQILGTSPSALFGEEPGSDAKSIPELGLVETLIGTADGIALNKAFVNIQDPRLRKAIIALVRTIADDNSAE
jgi:transcriptional regulator with XRE-family HTH domain